MVVRVQCGDFDPEVEAAALSVTGAGARVSFVGTVRELGQAARVAAIEVEHYPQMTERELERIATEARHRYDLLDVLILHRVGRLEAGDRIVLVVVWSLHRKAAFEACASIIDVLKTRAPFWKKEITDQGAEWVKTETPWV